jgi:uncharacterized protein YjiS (DUF1127 family)
MISSAANGAAAVPSVIRPAGGAGWFIRAARAVLRAYRVGRCRRALSMLSDHTLKDIGITRSEIDFLADAMVDNHRDPSRLPPSMWVQG